MANKTTLKQIKRIPFVFFGLILCYLALNVSFTLASIGDVKKMNVSLGNIDPHLIEMKVGEHQFITGREGELTWQIKNAKEAFLVNLSDPGQFLSFYDLVYLLFINVAVYWMLKGITEQTVFSEKVNKGLRMIGALIALYPLMMLLNAKLAGYFVEELTAKRFTATFRNVSMAKFMLAAVLFELIPFYMDKGKSLQEEQNLTI